MSRRKPRPRALCRYCFPSQTKGRVHCGHCGGYREPSRRKARKQGRVEAE